MQNAVNAAYFIGTTAPMYKINPSLSVFHTIPDWFVSINSLFLKNVTTPSVSTVLDHQAQLVHITKGKQVTHLYYGPYGFSFFFHYVLHFGFFYFGCLRLQNNLKT